MADIDVGQGVVVRTTDDVDVRVVRGEPALEGAVRGTRRATRRGAASAAAATTDLQTALDDAGFTVAAEVELAPRRPGVRALRSAGAEPTEIEVKVSPNESALVLVEGEGGVYAWAYPKDEGLVPARRTRSAQQQTLVFSLTPPSGAPATRRGAAPSARRGAVLDWIGDKLIEPVRAYVLKFAVNVIVDVAVDYLEGDKPEGLISMAGDDVTKWQPGATALPPWPKDRPARVLLMIHGTFSSTAGGFGHLLLSESGKSFLQRARAKYDAILAFDHKTLVVDPKANADALMDALEKSGLPKGSSIDAVAHSRGGLVYRTFAEQVLGKRRPDVKLGKAVFVGCTNGGTHLAEPANWVAMIDLYTNALMAGARAAVSLAGGAVLSPLISTGIKTLGRFVQMFSEVAIADGRVPGLAAMQPSSTTVKGLNEATGGLERLAAYYAVTSNFEARLEPRNGITKELAEFIVDRVTNRLFQVDNDLVVDTDSMVEFGSRKPQLEAGGAFAFGNTDDVYHTIYFATEQLPSRLVEWLELPESSPQPGAGLESLSPEPGGALEGGPRPKRSSSLAPAPGAGAAEPMDVPRRRRGTRSSGLESFRPDASEPVEVEAPAPAPSRRAAPPKPAAKPEAKPAAKPAAESVPCHFAAEMDPFPPLRKRVPLYVSISRDKIEVAEHAAAATTVDAVAVDSSRPIEVEVIAQKNCKVVGDARAEFKVPGPNRPEALRFDIEGIGKGEADLLVEARQGTRTLVSFQLAPVFVDKSEPLRVTQVASAGADGPEQPAVLRIYEIDDGKKVTLRFDLACYKPNIFVSESRSLPALSRAAYVADKFEAIEKAWLGSNDSYENFLFDLRAQGTVMANELLPDPVREALWQHREDIRAIQVVSEEPFIPWELLYVTDPRSGPKGAGFLCEWGLVRWLHNTRWPGGRLAMRGDHVHYVIPDYKNPDNKLEGAAAEQGMLRKVFGNPQPLTPGSRPVAAFLESGAQTCDVLHFACHGESEQRAVVRAELLMNDTQVGRGFVNDKLSAEVIKTHTRFSPDANSIVFINACQVGQGGSGLAAGVAGFVDSFLRPYSKQGAGALVGALWSVSDDIAFTFAETFYGELKKKQTLVDAVRAAREASKKGGNDLTWLAYTVYGNPFARVG